MNRRCLIVALIVVAQPALAGPLKGEGEVGYTQTSGNTDTASLNVKLSLSKDSEAWRHSGELAVLSAATDSKTTAEAYTLKARTNYKLGSKRYVFGALRYENDRFSGFDYQGSLVLGYGKSSQEGVLLLNGNFAAPLSDSATFTEDLSIEAGSDNTYSESVTGLKLKVLDNLAAKIAYTVKRNSSVPAGSHKTDLQTAVTLVYAF